MNDGLGSIIPALSSYYGSEVGREFRERDLIQAYRIHPWVHAAVKVIANSIARVPVKVLQLEGPRRAMSLAEFKYCEGIQRWDAAFVEYKQAVGGKIIDDHWLLDLLRNPLPKAGLTKHDLLQAVVSYLETDGRAYIEKQFKTEAQREVVGLWPMIDPRNMLVIPGKDELIAGYTYRRGGRTVVYKPEQMIYLRYWDLENPYGGLSPVEVLRQALIADVRAIDYNRMFFENSAEPPFYLETDQKVGRTDRDLILEQYEERHRGHAFRPAFFGQGIKPKTLTPTHKDMAFLELRKWTREEIFGVYGIPLFMVGIREGINRATAWAERRNFWENTILPRVGKVEDAFNRALVPEGDNKRLIWDVSSIEALQEDTEIKSRTGSRLLVNGWTPNEIRNDLWGKPKSNELGARQIYVPGNFDAVAEVNSTKFVDGQTVAIKDIETKDEPLVGNVEDFLPPSGPGRVAQRAVHEKHLPVVAMSGAEHGVDTLTALGMEVPANWEEIYNFQDAISAWLEEGLASKVREIDGVTRDRAAKVLRRGLDEGKGLKAVAKDLRDEFGAMSKHRSLAIARTDGGRAVSFGQHKLYSDTGVEKHGWVAQMVDTRPTHEDAHVRYGPGDEIGINIPFAVGGEMLIAPRMGFLAENNINCYCDERPIVEGIKEYTPEMAKDFKAWLKSVEEEGAGKAYRQALAKFFEQEGERYVEYLLKQAGI